MALSQKGQLTAKPADKQAQPQKKPPGGSSLAPFLNSTNMAPTYAIKIMHSQVAQTSGSLQVDYKLLSSGHAIYLSHCLCAADDFSLLRRLTADLETNNGASMIQWSRHLKHENPSFSPTFQEIVDRMVVHRFWGLSLILVRLLILMWTYMQAGSISILITRAGSRSITTRTPTQALARKRISLWVQASVPRENL
jgi:hypothetical protein